uniref:Uncharacterized protein n=1 Tax=Chrysotila carterae TaxID=13221 RepID=A0A7S4BKE7_CHRCT
MTSSLQSSSQQLEVTQEHIECSFGETTLFVFCWRFLQLVAGYVEDCVFALRRLRQEVDDAGSADSAAERQDYYEGVCALLLCHLAEMHALRLYGDFGALHCSSERNLDFGVDTGRG